jgi:hypothetical protein
LTVGALEALGVAVAAHHRHQLALAETPSWSRRISRRRMA